MNNYIFRGKRKDNGEWVYWNQFGECTEPYLDDCCMCSHIAKEHIIPETVGMWTGLEDKNGVKIFDGDIIRDTREHAADEPGIIEWSNIEDEFTYHCGFRVVWQERIPRRSHLSFWANEREIEVIGNIHTQEGDKQ